MIDLEDKSLAVKLLKEDYTYPIRNNKGSPKKYYSKKRTVKEISKLSIFFIFGNFHDYRRLSFKIS